MAKKALAREKGVDFILAVGGGSVIDCCKVISAQAVLVEDIYEMEYSKGRFPTARLPMGAVVTAFGTTTSFAVLDPAYTSSVPPM